MSGDLVLWWPTPVVNADISKDTQKHLVGYLGTYTAVPGKEANGQPVYRNGKLWLSFQMNGEWILCNNEDEHLGQNAGCITCVLGGDCCSGFVGPSWNTKWKRVPGMRLLAPLVLGWPDPVVNADISEGKKKHLDGYLGTYTAVPDKVANGQPVYRNGKLWLSFQTNGEWTLSNNDDHLGQNAEHITCVLGGSQVRRSLTQTDSPRSLPEARKLPDPTDHSA